MIHFRKTSRPRRILDFDIENRPLAYLGPDYTTAEVTAIACSWVGESEVTCALLGLQTPKNIFQYFVDLYDQADIVTGHYILRHDLPVLNGALAEVGMLPLKPKYVSDTKVHLPQMKYLSKSQENLAGMLGMFEAKHHMTNAEWREANRLTEIGIQLTAKRVVDDVIQHKALREALLAAGLLGEPELWQP